MENKKILETAGQELEKRVSAVSNLQQTVEWVRSNLLDLLLEDENPKTREELGNPIKEELDKKLQIAKAHKPPRVIYIANLEKVMGDLDTRIQGEKADNTRKHLIDLNKKNTFNEAVIKQFVEEIFEVAKTTKNIEKESIYTKLMGEPWYKEDALRLLEHRKEKITDTKQKANIEIIIKKLKKYVKENK